MWDEDFDDSSWNHANIGADFANGLNGQDWFLNTNTNINNLKNNIDKVLEFKENLNISGEIDNTSNSNYQNTDEEFKSIINTSINNEIELINKKIKELEEIKSFHQNLITDLNDKQNLNDIIIQDLLNSFNKMKTNK